LLNTTIAAGMVFEAKLLGSDERVALKKISKKTVALEDFTREMATLKTIHEAGGMPINMYYNTYTAQRTCSI
jgi:serine/threonine protein kinase